MQIMAIAIIPVAVSVHTIVSFDFSMAPVPMWHSTMFGPYFVAGAIFSGIAALILAMALVRRFLHLEAYLHPVHFQNLGKLLLMMSLLWAYFIFSERLTAWYGNEPGEIAAFLATQRGSYAPLFWTMVVCNLVIPVPILSLNNLRAAGVPEPQITVISSEPIEEYEFSHRDQATWLHWIAGGGGAIGLALGTWLTRMTELAWPLPTGNMPIVAWWPNLIVMFELT